MSVITGILVGTACGMAVTAHFDSLIVGVPWALLTSGCLTYCLVRD